MKAVLLSIQPKWCELIASGEKTVEIRKTKPKLETPFKVYIYCTKGRGDCLWRWNGIWYDTQDPNHRPNRLDGNIIGEFVCKKIEDIQIRHFTVFGHENLYTAVGENPDNQWLKHSCLSYSEVVQYGNLAPLYGWQISDLVIYDEPKELSEFFRKCEATRCEGCEHLKYQRVNRDEYDYDCEYFNYKIPIARPPQSWCYVEERSEK